MNNKNKLINIDKYTIIVIISTTKLKMCLKNDLDLSAPSKKDKTPKPINDGMIM